VEARRVVHVQGEVGGADVLRDDLQGALRTGQVDGDPQRVAGRRRQAQVLGGARPHPERGAEVWGKGDRARFDLRGQQGERQERRGEKTGGEREHGDPG
jgi:hypothetical protein